VVLVVGAGVFVATLDASSVNISLPRIARSLDADLLSVQWIALAYLIGMNGLMLPFGRLSDLVGRKRISLTGFAFFGIGGLLSFLSPGLGYLIAARIFQSIGAAMLQSTGAGLIVGAFPAKERGRAMGLNGSIVSVGLLVGPVVGGLVTDTLGWRYIFILPVPIAVLALIAGSFLLRETGRIRNERFDTFGAILVMLWIAPLIYLLNQGKNQGWGSPLILSLAAVVIAAFAAFIFSQVRVRHPIVSLSIFRVRLFSLSVLIAILTFMALAGSILLTPFLLQNLLGLTVAESGFMMALIPVGSVSLAMVGGALADRYGPRIPATIGLLMMAAAMASFAFIEPDTSVTSIIPRLLLLGFGQGLFMSPNSSSIMGSLPRSKLGLAGGFLAWSRTFAFASGQAIWGAVFATVVLISAGAGTVLDAPASALQSGFAAGYFGCAGALLVAAVLASARGRVTAPVEADPAAPITLREDDSMLGWPARSDSPSGS
jgi:EmrB/QacA subfamily drug resistance transporter